MAIVKLKLREDSKKGFQVTLKETNRDDDMEGHLQPLPQEIDPTKEKSAFCRWQLGYREEEEVRSSYTSSEQKRRITPIGIKYSSPKDYAKDAEDVKTHLNQWLNCGDNEWLRIRDELVAICARLNSASDEVGVLLDVKDINLCRLPWQEWNFFENHCPQAEIIFRLPKSKDGKPIIHPPSSSKIRILVVVGRNNGINTDQDLKEIERLEKLGAEIKYLEQPKHDVLCDALWNQQGYHIFIFTGHSVSKDDGEIGWIELNDQKERLSIEELKNALKEAINKGLQLAIFNSCDGLGLANQLAQLHLPQSIVMREPVPDQVAVKFLEYLFEEFTHGKSLFAAVHKSRKRLEDLFKSRYPGVHWLPVICVSHSVKKPLTWQELIESCSANDVSKPAPKKSPITPKFKQNWIAVGLLLLVLSGGVVIWWVTNQKQPQIVVRTSQRNFTDVSGIPQGKWLFNGSTSWEEIIKKVHPNIQQELRQITLSLRPHPTSRRGSQIGINMLKNGEISFALSSRHLKPDEQQDVLGNKLQQNPVADDVIAIVVNRNLGISKITVEQLEGIYTDKFTNWKDLGGPDVPITPYSRPPEASGTAEFFKENILQGRNFGKNVKVMPTTTEIQKIIGRTEGGIYYLTKSEISKSLVKPLRINGIEPKETDRYPIIRRLFVITKQDGRRDEQIGNAYVQLLLTNQGQELIQEALQQQK